MSSISEHDPSETAGAQPHSQESLAFHQVTALLSGGNVPFLPTITTGVRDLDIGEEAEESRNVTDDTFEGWRRKPRRERNVRSIVPTIT